MESGLQARGRGSFGRGGEIALRIILGWIATLMLCSAVLTDAAHAQPAPQDEWYTYRHDIARTGVRPFAGNLSDPAKLHTLAVKWSFPGNPPPSCGPSATPATPPSAFTASPIVVHDTVFIGSSKGHFYALDAATGACKWQYPKPGDPPLLGNGPAWQQYGIGSSASYWDHGPNGAVIFGAQDPALGPYGSARLFALDAKTGAEVWKSEMVAEINGPNEGSLTELHQRIAYSSPLIYGGRAFVGISSFAGDKEDGHEVGRVIAVGLADANIDPGFSFYAVGRKTSPPGTVHGGGVWNSLAADSTAVYFTTGNTNLDPLHPQPEPQPNYGLSMIRVNKDSGSIVWWFQPVPFILDYDPDWAAGATVMSTSCGELIASVQKDGWSYAVDAANGSCRWQFPPVCPPVGDRASSPCKSAGYSKFDPHGPKLHVASGDIYYHRPGAAWNDVFIVTTGGENLVSNPSAGLTKLHALNACATNAKDLVRWIADIPLDSGPPTVTGGIVFVGTNTGHLIVLADPTHRSIPHENTCANQQYTNESDCTRAGFNMVPFLKPLASIAMPDGGKIGAVRREPVPARGRVFVATDAGHVYMLAASDEPPIPPALIFARGDGRRHRIAATA
jgi:outer membrane protein assembly factor BamB